MLDDKLRELLSDENTIKHCCGQRDCNDIEADIAQIKQAFADEGYKRVQPANKPLGVFIATGPGQYRPLQEPENPIHTSVEEAARKASGVDK